jgi:hypothetical protein
MNEIYPLSEPHQIPGSHFCITGFNKLGQCFVLSKKRLSGVPEVDARDSLPAMALFTRLAEMDEDVPDYEAFERANKVALGEAGREYGKDFFETLN